jgi:hypothetical protein
LAFRVDISAVPWETVQPFWPESAAAVYPSVVSKLVETRRSWPLAAPATVIVKAVVLDPNEFVAVRVTSSVPAEMGVPEISPVVVLIERPLGRPLAPKLVGLFVAVI